MECGGRVEKIWCKGWDSGLGIEGREKEARWLWVSTSSAFLVWHLNSLCVPQVDTWQAFGNSALAARQEGSGQTRVGKQEKNYRPLPAAHLIPEAHILSSQLLYILITRLRFCRTKSRWKVIHKDCFLSQEPYSLCIPRHVATFQYSLMVWLIGLSLDGRD